MTPDPYRKAYDKALADLTSISETFERLHTRKKLVENVIAALQPVFEQADPEAAAEASAENLQPPAESSATAEEVQAEPAATYSFLAVPSPLPESDGDPFQRRSRANFHFKGLSAQRSA